MTGEKSDISRDSQILAQQKRMRDPEEDFIAQQELQLRMGQIKHKILVLSGKGGMSRARFPDGFMSRERRSSSPEEWARVRKAFSSKMISV
jgi:hypothetical protein